MKLKNVLLLCLALTLCLGLAACNSGAGEDPETVRKDLAGMTDADLIPLLLENYASYAEPAVFSAEMSWSYRNGDVVIASMEGTVRSTGVDRLLSRTCTVGEDSKTASYVYSGGVCYINAGTKTKTSAEGAAVAAYFASLYPAFGKVSDYNFQDKELLRSEDGTYSLVLFLPANGIADSADIIAPLTEAGNDAAPVTMSDFSDIYLTLRFSSEGKLIGQTLGADCEMTAEGIESEGTLLLKFSITSSDPVQNPVSAPDDAASYKDAQTDPFAPAEPVTDGAEDASDGE